MAPLIARPVSSSTSLRVEHVSKAYGSALALDDVSFDLRPGEVLGLLGPNGAGKTSLIRMLLDLTRPDSGRLFVLGEAPSTRVRERIGYLPEERGLYPKQRVLDVLSYLGSLAGLSRPEAKRRAERWLERAGLSEWGRRRVRELSKGMQQKVQLGAAVLHDPELLILDEPFTGLDPVNRRLVSDVIRELRERGAATIVSTHLMDQVERLCDRVVLLREGRLLLEGEVGEVRRGFAGSSVSVECAPVWESDRAVQALITAVKRSGSRFELTLAPEATPTRLLGELVRSGAEIEHFSRSLPSLDEVFVLAIASGRGESESPPGATPSEAPS